MKIIALSDTHSQPLNKALVEALEGADLIVHVGDFCDAEVYHRLKAITEIRAVYGNMDGSDLREFLPKQVVFSCDGVRIGLAHGEGSPEGIIPRLQVLFKDQQVDLVIFGHSHIPCQQEINGVLFFNPGSPTDIVRSPYLSYGLIEIKAGKAKARIVKIN